MNGEKSIFLSKTFWGAMVALIGSFCGWGAETQELITADVSNMAQAASVLVGAILTTYGRMKANTKIGGGASAPLVLLLILPAFMAAQGCALVQVQPETPTEMVAAVEVDLANAYDAVTKAFILKKIDWDKANRLKNVLDEAGSYLDEAHLAYADGDKKGAVEWVDLARPMAMKVAREVINGR